jgi:hypothetical protein
VTDIDDLKTIEAANLGPSTQVMRVLDRPFEPSLGL